MRRWIRLASLVIPVLGLLFVANASATTSYAVNYVITATGTQTVTTAPDQTFTWTVDGTATEHWWEERTETFNFSWLNDYYPYTEWRFSGPSYPPGAYAINDFTLTVTSQNNAYVDAQYRTYPNPNHIRFSFGVGERNCSSGWLGTSCSTTNGSLVGSLTYKYRVPLSAPVSASNSGTGSVNFNEGVKVIESSALPTFPTPNGGFISGASYVFSQNNSAVDANLTGAQITASTDVLSTGEGVWTATETGTAIVADTDVDLLIATSSLVAPNGDTSWSITDDHALVSTSMTGNQAFATGTPAPTGPGTVFDYTVGATGTQQVLDSQIRPLIGLTQEMHTRCGLNTVRPLLL